MEKEAELGGFARRLHHTIEGADIQAYLKQLAAEVTVAPEDPGADRSARIAAFEGFKGNFVTSVRTRARTAAPKPSSTVSSSWRPAPANTGRRNTSTARTPGCSRRWSSATCSPDPKGPRLQSVVMIQCVGSRNEQNVNCSRICCQNAVKNALALKKAQPRRPGVRPLPGHAHLRADGGLLHRGPQAGRHLHPLRARGRAAGFSRRREGVVVRVKDHVLQRDIEILADRLVLSAGVAAADTADVSALMKLNRNPEGFFIEAHVKLRPVDMPSEGVFLCGTAHGPKLISETIAQAQAAASRASTLLSKDSIKLSAITAKVETDHCVKCLTCVRSCPFGVPQFNAAGEGRRDQRGPVPRMRGVHGGLPAADHQPELLRRRPDRLQDRSAAERGGGLMPEFEPTIIAFCCEY